MKLMLIRRYFVVQVPVGIWKDHFGDDKKIGPLYYNVETLSKKLKGIVSAEEKLQGYEKIRTVGKGTYGKAPIKLPNLRQQRSRTKSEVF